MRNALIRWSRPGNNLPLLVSLMMAGSLLLPAVVRAAPPAFVQMTYRAITSGGSIAVALPKQNTAGNLLVVYVVWDSAAAVSLTDTRSNPYISAVGPTRDSGGTATAQIFYAKNIAGGTNTVTATFAAPITSDGEIYVHEYSGIDRLSPVDAAVAASGSSSSMTSGSLSTRFANDLLFGGGESKLGSAAYAWWYDPGNGTYTAISGSPFANTGIRQFRPSGNNSAGSGDWVLVLDAVSTPPDTQASSIPAGLSATSVTSSDIAIAWAPSHDNTAVAGYTVYRDGALIGTTPSPSYTDTGLSPLTSYAYRVAAFDHYDNASAPSAALVVATTAPAPAFVQQGYATPQSPQTVVTAAYGGVQVAGNTNIIAIGWNDMTATLVSVTDSAGNIYQAALPTYRGNGLSQAMYYASDIAAAPAGGNQVTVSFNQPAVYVDLRIAEYSGLSHTNPVQAGVSATGQGAAADSGALTTTGGSVLLFAAGITSAVFTAPGSGFTTRVITTPDGDIVEDGVAASAGTYRARASLTAGTWILQLAAFRPAGQAP